MMGGHDEARAVMMVMLALLVAVACTSKPNPLVRPFEHRGRLSHTARMAATGLESGESP